MTDQEEGNRNRTLGRDILSFIHSQKADLGDYFRCRFMDVCILLPLKVPNPLNTSECNNVQTVICCTTIASTQETCIRQFWEVLKRIVYGIYMVLNECFLCKTCMVLGTIISHSSRTLLGGGGVVTLWYVQIQSCRTFCMSLPAAIYWSTIVMHL